MSDVEPRPQITKVWAKNFRSIEFAELELGSLTVLVGPNASGKSNLLDVLRFIADATTDGLDAALTDRGGISLIRRKVSDRKAFNPELGLQFRGNDYLVDYEFALTSEKGGQYKVAREYAKVQTKELLTEPLEVEIRNGRLRKPSLAKGGRGRGNIRDQLHMLKGTEALQFDQHFLALPFDRISILFMLIYERNTSGEARQALRALAQYLEQIRFYHIFPNSLREPQKIADRYPLEEQGGNLASVLHDMIQRESPFLEDLRSALGYVVPGLCGVKVTPVTGGYLVVEINHETSAGDGRKVWFDLSQESDGTLRLLGLLVALYQDPPPSLIAIEEPELTIHPGALAVLADVMQEAALRTQVLITTHSPDLIDRLPIQSIRAVTSEDGMTETGAVAEEQREAVRKGLFSPGELHRMEGLHIATKES